MQYLEEWLETDDGHAIPVKVWRPRQPDRILVIVHGMAEHAARYASLAEWLTERQVAVVAIEQRGHSDDCPEEDLGHLADHDGWQKAVNDVIQVVAFAHQLEPGLPLTLFGHSMGSFVVQNVVQQDGTALDAVILSSTRRVNRPLLRLSKLAVAVIGTLTGWRNASGLIEKIEFGSYSRKFKPNRTDFDWISRDTDQVDAYIEDAYCGFPCTPRFWSDMTGGLIAIQPQLWPRDLPVHLMSGTDDPLGGMGVGIRGYIEDLRRAGVRVESTRLFDGGRHELIHEINAGEVWQHLESCLASQTRS
ncbi:alpha/beta fold hydrolase [Saccharospirillum mangrovi]|uniref:alpha/beta fold hydrolase n=1 Tax=Saccharospirillum mangrovi TaxID=2161747 RepID=UPI000D3C7F01|nr:alpha/beta fold hydrolase [Saccharospirillum mangrovi]